MGLKKCLLALALISGVMSSVDAQVIYNSTGRKGDAKYRDNAKVKGFDKNKLILGTGFDFGLGNRYFLGGISPIVGYRVTDWFSAGLSGRFTYVSQKDYYMFQMSNGTYEYKPLRQRVYGPGAWVRLMPIPNYFVHTEFEYNTLSTTEYQSPTMKITDKYNVPSLMVGVGFRAPVSERLSLVTLILYDVLQNTEKNTVTDPFSGQRYSLSPYSGQLNYRFGINFNF